MEKHGNPFSTFSNVWTQEILFDTKQFHEMNHSINIQRTLFSYIIHNKKE